MEENVAMVNIDINESLQDHKPTMKEEFEKAPIKEKSNTTLKIGTKMGNL